MKNKRLFFPPSTIPVKSVLLLFVFLSLTAEDVYSQSNVAKAKMPDVSGTLSVTNNGISIVPALGLGKPATLINLSVGNRFRFEPQLDFSMNGKPWQFLFWVGYDLINKGRFLMTFDANAAYLFRTVPALIQGNNTSKNIIQTRRVLGVDMNARYVITPKFDVGLYYLFGYGFESSVPTQTHYLSLYSDIPAIPLFADVHLNIRPQIYYLKIDSENGLYVASNFTLGMKEIPVTISSTVDKIIVSQISGNEDPLWDVSLNYSFRF